MKRNAVLNIMMRELALHGIKPTLSHKGKHIKLSWKNSQGQDRWAVAPCTPGDKRSHLNNRAWVRQLLRKDGMLPV